MDIKINPLPPYIVECFSVSGFDDIDAIAEMCTDDGPKNSVSVIESFIDKRKANHPKCMGPHQSPNDPFEFLPGHRLRIQKFINDVKCRSGVKNSTRQIRVKTKKRKVETTYHDMDDGDIPTATDKIRKKVTKWSENNRDSVLQENVHYTILVKCNALDASKLAAYIRCHCGKALMIQRKSDGSRPWQLSNWTKHYKQCNYKKGAAGKQDKLQSFFPVVSKKGNTQLAMVSANTKSASVHSSMLGNHGQSSKKIFYFPYVVIPSSSYSSYHPVDPSSQMSSLTASQLNHSLSYISSKQPFLPDQGNTPPHPPYYTETTTVPSTSWVISESTYISPSPSSSISDMNYADLGETLSSHQHSSASTNPHNISMPFSLCSRP